MTCFGRRRRMSLCRDSGRRASAARAAGRPRDREVAHDVLQNVFVNIWRKIESYDPSKGRLFTWMLNITRNTCIDYLRSRNHKYQVLTDANTEPGTKGAAESVHPYHSEHNELRALAHKLDTKYRQVIDLVYFWGYSQDEVAKMLNMPLGTVKTRSRTGIQQLRIWYAELNN